MGFLPMSDSPLAAKRVRGKISFLITKGNSFNLDESHDFTHVLKWMRESHQVLAPFLEEQDEFSLFCLNSFAFPKDRVLWGVQVLEKALEKLRDEEGQPACPTFGKKVYQHTGT